MGRGRGRRGERGEGRGESGEERGRGERGEGRGGEGEGERGDEIPKVKELLKNWFECSVKSSVDQS